MGVVHVANLVQRGLVVPDSPHEIFIGGLLNYVNEDQVKDLLIASDVIWTVAGLELDKRLILNYVYRLRTFLLFVILFFILHVSTSAGHLQVFYIYLTISYVEHLKMTR
jgi:hypothetical protein